MKALLTFTLSLWLALSVAANPLIMLSGSPPAAGGGATIAVVASTVQAPGVGTVALTPINTTGANLIVVSLSWYSAGGGALTLSDSNGNTWTALTSRTNTRLYYCANPTVGAGHTFTITPTAGDVYPVVAVLAVSGANAAPFEEETGNVSSTQPGNLTPDTNGSLIVTSFEKDASAQPTVSGFTNNLTLADTPAVNIAGGMSYLIQTTAAAINPTWSATGSVAGAVFKP